MSSLFPICFQGGPSFSCIATNIAHQHNYVSRQLFHFRDTQIAQQYIYIYIRPEINEYICMYDQYALFALCKSTYRKWCFASMDAGRLWTCRIIRQRTQEKWPAQNSMRLSQCVWTIVWLVVVEYDDVFLARVRSSLFGSIAFTHYIYTYRI